jgi:CheY-like chemotaxis protein
MSLNGPIVLIDDDHDDLYLIKNILVDLHIPNELIFFQNGKQALDYLWVTQDKPLLILCDMNMPIMTGLELRDQIDVTPYLRNKSIPFIFLSTAHDLHLIEEGFYKKEHHYEALKQNIDIIVRYWKACLHPNNIDPAER